MDRTLKSKIEFEIRFYDTDPMGIVWHGNYLKFFENGREHFGEEYGLSYLSMYDKGFFTPIIKSNIEHKSPLNYGDKAYIITEFNSVKSAKLIFEYEIWNKTTNKLSAIGSTTQVFLTKNSRELVLYPPDFFIEWKTKMNLI